MQSRNINLSVVQVTMGLALLAVQVTCIFVSTSVVSGISLSSQNPESPSSPQIILRSHRGVRHRFASPPPVSLYIYFNVYVTQNMSSLHRKQDYWFWLKCRFVQYFSISEPVTTMRKIYNLNVTYMAGLEKLPTKFDTYLLCYAYYASAEDSNSARNYPEI